LRLPCDLTASLAVRYFGTNIYRVTAGTTIFGKYTVADLNITKKLLDFEDKGRLTLKAAVNNITNEYYVLSPDYPKPRSQLLRGLGL
jgi:outer membrane receptor protein involved in Fe transport